MGAFIETDLVRAHVLFMMIHTLSPIPSNVLDAKLLIHLIHAFEKLLDADFSYDPFMWA